MTKDYNASDIEVLSGLEPVQKRPGMYTDTDCPNHLVYEVIDNSVDEAIAGHCKIIQVNLYGAFHVLQLMLITMVMVMMLQWIVMITTQQYTQAQQKYAKMA